MEAAESSCEPTARSGAGFSTTHWSVVLAAGDPASPQAVEALETLCRAYWRPLYAYVRRQGRSPEDAQDLTQDFLAHMLGTGFLRGAAPERGRFRSFLLASLRHFLVDQHRYHDALKRGGSQSLVSLDESRGEASFRLEPQDDLTPEKLYEREWAMTLLSRARSRLRAEYAAAGHLDLHDRLQSFPLTEKGERSFAEAAVEFGTSEGALKSAVHRLRARYRELVREEVAHTVADPAELQEEARHLIMVISG